MVKAIAVIGSPKNKGNTETLTDSFLSGCESQGAETKKVLLRKLKFRSCTGCNKCHETGRCALKDDITPILDEISSDCDILILSSPVYSMTVTAEMKAFIDRGQYLWAKIFKTGEISFSDEWKERHPGIFISTAGIDMPEVFDHCFPTARAFFNDSGFGYIQNITANAMDRYGGINGREDILNEARISGAEITKKLMQIKDLP